MNEYNLIPAVDKAFALIEHLGRNPGGSSQAELSAKLGISASTCYRILQTMLRHDFVRKIPGGRFDLSSGLLSAAQRLFDDARRFERVQPLLDDLAAKTSFSCKLSIRQGFEQVSILRAESPSAVSVSGKIGARFPLIEGSVGAALICDDPDDLERLAKSCKEPLEEAANPALVEERVAQIKSRGYALNARPNRWNIEAMSVPVRDASRSVVAALTLIGFQDEFKDLPALSKALLETASAISKTI